MELGGRGGVYFSSGKDYVGVFLKVVKMVTMWEEMEKTKLRDQKKDSKMIKTKQSLNEQR